MPIPATAENAADELRRSVVGASVLAKSLDLSAPISINDFVERRTAPLHVLISDAGLIALPELQRNIEGWES